MMARRALAAAIVIVTAVVEAWALFIPSSPIEAHGVRSWTVDQFGSGAPVGETFRALATDLSEVRLQFASNVPARVALQCRLMTFTGIQPDPWGSLYAWKTTMDLPQGASWQRFRFEPVPRSDNVIYLFRVQLLDYQAARPGDPKPSVRLLGSLDNALREGNVIAGPEQILDRDLMFEAHYDNSAFARFHRDAQRSLPRSLRPLAVQLALLALYNAVFGVYIVTMVAGSRA